MSVQVLVPAALDFRRPDEGWAVLRGMMAPAEAIAFCWSRENAEEIAKAINSTPRPTAEQVWLAPAVLHEGDS